MIPNPEFELLEAGIQFNAEYLSFHLFLNR